MSAYWISVYREINDEAKVAAYAEIAGPALRGRGRHLHRPRPAGAGLRGR